MSTRRSPKADLFLFLVSALVLVVVAYAVVGNPFAKPRVEDEKQVESIETPLDKIVEPQARVVTAEPKPNETSTSTETSAPLPRRVHVSKRMPAAQQSVEPVAKYAPIILHAPAVGEILWLSGSEDVHFRWSPIPLALKYKLELSRDAQMQHLISVRSVVDAEWSGRVSGSGPLYWRVEAVDGEGHPYTSPVSEFSIAMNRGPMLIQPKRAEIFEIDERDSRSGLNIDFIWGEASIVDAYELEVASDANFTKVEVSTQTAVSRHLQTGFIEGHYFWRVRSVHHTLANPVWSEMGDFRVTVRPTPQQVIAPLLAVTPLSLAPAKAVPVAESAIQREVAQTAILPTASPVSPPPVTPPVPLAPPQSASQTASQTAFEVPPPVVVVTPVSPPKVAPTPQAPVAKNEPICLPPPREQAEAKKEIPPDYMVLNEDTQHFWLWLGMGVDYTYYAQDVGLTNVKYSLIDSPSYYVRAGSMINSTYGMDFSYKDIPGQAKSSDSVTVVNGNYHWQTISAEGLARVAEYRSRSGLDNWWGMRFGVQQHMVPFMISTNVGEIEMRNNSMTMATLGVDYIVGRNRRVRYEFMARYQYPLATAASGNDDFSIVPKYAFDGSIGQVYKISPQWSLGIYWYGQWHQYQFSYRDNSVHANYNGNQTLFFSDLDLRIGFDF